MRGLVLSLFSGLAVLDQGFREEGWCVVSAGDLVRSGFDDIRELHFPAGRFDGVIGGDPCQSHSGLANLVRAKGLEPRFPDLTPEVQRVIEETAPVWFLRENVPGAPALSPKGYNVTSFMLKNHQLDSGNGFGEAQMRKRRFWFGWREELGPAPSLQRWIAGCALELADAHRTNSVIQTLVRNDPKYRARRAEAKQAPVTGRHDGAVGSPTKNYAPPRRSLADMLELQGLPQDLLDHSPMTMTGKRRLVGNAVPLQMSRAIAQAVSKALEVT